MLDWQNINGIATLVCSGDFPEDRRPADRESPKLGPTGYEVRVTLRLKNARPVRWGIAYDGHVIDGFKSFAAAKRGAEHRRAAEIGYYEAWEQ